MSDRPFHHGNLRTVLLDEAEKVLRKSGIEELSLRGLARDAGVSHGAPRSHFIDRKALLDALAERGFLSLARVMRDAAQNEADYTESLRACARAYLGFAVTNAALVDLMFTAKMDRPPGSLLAAAETLFTTINDIIASGVDSGAFPADEVERRALLISSTMQGISTFVTAGRATPKQGDLLIDDAVSLFLARPLNQS
jgi:AcrR family transcriptional regulator